VGLRHMDLRLAGAPDPLVPAAPQPVGPVAGVRAAA